MSAPFQRQMPREERLKLSLQRAKLLAARAAKAEALLRPSAG